MPIYEFECDACGARFDKLVRAGTQSVACEQCGTDRTRRVFSPQAQVPRLVKTPREARKQERRNAQLQRNARERFKQARRRQAERAKRAGRGG